MKEVIHESAEQGTRAELHGALRQIEQGLVRRSDDRTTVVPDGGEQVALQRRERRHQSVTPSFQIAISR
jgi:hypothetical protein